MDIRRINNIVYRTFEKEDVCGIMLSGSYATAMQNKNSDLDVVVLSRFACRQTTAEIIENNTRIHYVLFPQNKIYDLVYEDILRERFVYVSLFRNGQILLDREGILHSIKRNIAGLVPSLSEQTIANMLHCIMEDLSYLKRNSNAFSIALDAYNRTQQIIIGFLTHSVKFLDKEMNRFANYKVMMNKMLADYVKNRNFTEFSSKIKGILNHFCTPPLEYSSTDTLLRVSDSGKSMIFVPNRILKDSDIPKLFTLCSQKFPSIILFAFYVGNCNIHAKGSYLAIIHSSVPQSELSSFISDYIKKEEFSFEVQMYFPYNTIFFDLNLFGGKSVETQVFNLFAKCTKFVFGATDNPIDGIVLAYITTLYIFYLLGEQKENFFKSILMIYMPDAINVSGCVWHNELSYRYKKLIRFLSNSYINNCDRIYLSLKNLFNNNLDICKHCEEISKKIITIAFASKELPYNTYLFRRKEQSIIFNLYNHVLSTFSLDNYQKMTICYNCSKIRLDVFF